jgi:hypothetical protein
MPAKARRSKRRTGNAAAELQAWRCAFEYGADFFGALAEIGVTWEATEHYRDPVYPAIVWSNANDVFRELARETWQRLGAAYMRRRDPAAHHNRVPWALAEFGPPPPG